MQELTLAAQTENLRIFIRGYAAQRGTLAEFIEESIEAALRSAHAEPAGISFDRDEDARLADQLFRARRAGFGGITIQLTALRALCAPVGGLDAADARAVAFYARAAEDRPVALVLEDGDRELPAFSETRPLGEIIAAEPEPEADAEAVAVSEPVAVADAEPASEPEPEPEPLPEEALRHVMALEAARGPQTLAAFERLFVKSYLPLARWLDMGLEDARAQAAREEVRGAFSRAYTEAMPMFAVTGKRPRMVLDSIDLAGKLARQHRARTAQVLVVSKLRYDLGVTIAERVLELLEGRAVLAEQMSLFSGLPTTTVRQLDLVARGITALRSETNDDDTFPTAGTVRRIRVGSRDLYKLDPVQGDVVDGTARAIAKHASAQAPRTLLFVVGAHGFRVDDGVASSGGASPEEVIVPAHAFLLGELH